MEFDELLVTTGVDALVRLVKEKQKVELREAASLLNIPENTLEDWARVLEEEGILKLEYKLTRIHLVWIRPTEEEVATEVQSFREEKAGVEKEVEEVSRRVDKQTAGIEDLRRAFADFYTRAHPRMEQMAKAVANVPAAKTLGADVFAKQQAALAESDLKLDEIKHGLEEIRKEISSLGIERGGGESARYIESAERMRNELTAMENEVAVLRKRAMEQQAPTEIAMPSMGDMKKKFESLRKEMTDVRSRNARIREDMANLRESTEMLKSVAESIVGHEEKIDEMRKEMKGLTAEADQMLAKAKEAVAAVRKSSEMVERLDATTTVAKGLLTRFPNQEKVFSEVEALRLAEQNLDEKLDGMEKLFEAAGGRQVTAKQFTELTKKFEDRTRQMKQDLDALGTALEEEKGTYLVFQKIKERIVPSLETYQKQLAAIEEGIGRARTEAEALEESLRQDTKKLQEALKTQEIQGVITLAKDIQEKKNTLDSIREGLDELSDISDNLHKRVTLLSSAAKMLEIRTGGMEPGAMEAKRKELKNELELTADEETEFRKKREELKNIIMKLWEQEK